MKRTAPTEAELVIGDKVALCQINLIKAALALMRQIYLMATSWTGAYVSPLRHTSISVQENGKRPFIH